MLRGWGIPNSSASRAVSVFDAARTIESGLHTSTGTSNWSTPRAIARISADDCGNTQSTCSCWATSASASTNRGSLPAGTSWK